MQVNIDKKTGVLLAVIVLLATALVGQAVRNGSDSSTTSNSASSSMSSTMDHGDHGGSSTNEDYTDADVVVAAGRVTHECGITV